MSLLENLLDSASIATGISKIDLTYVFGKGERKVFEPGEYLFHESSPRLWAGIVEEGEVEIVRGLHGATTHLSTLAMGAMIGEGALLDETPHSTSAFTRNGAKVWIVLRADWEHVKKHDPEIFYRIVARVAQRQSERLRYVSDQLSGKAGPDVLLTAVRREHDLLGERDVPLSAYYGVQTLRSVENFPISGLPLKNFAHFVDALAMVKKAAAQANCELGVLAKEKMGAICAACDEILAGKLHDQFVVDMIQGGAGTSTNMNANEVIANRALEILGHNKGEYKFLHPNDDVNCSQSTNDAYPTAIKLAVYFSIKDTLGALGELHHQGYPRGAERASCRTPNKGAGVCRCAEDGSDRKSGCCADHSRTGVRRLCKDDRRRHGQHEKGRRRTAGDKYGSHCHRHRHQFPTGICRACHAETGASQRPAGHQGRKHGAGDSGRRRFCTDVSKHETRRGAALQDLQRSALDGFRTALRALRDPSAGLPGKVNPVMPEMVSQVCFTIIGYDVTVAMAGEAGELELNMAEPIMAYCLLHGLMILKNATLALTSRCIIGIKANEERCLQMVQNSIGLVTALNPVLGYEKSAAIAKEALETNGSVYELVLQKGWLTKEKLDDILKPENMTQPRRL